MTFSTISLEITWDKLPDDFILPDEPVDNIAQPLLAAALNESLEVAGKLPPNALTTTNYGICATLNGKIVVKAPDWSYIPVIRASRAEVNRSYTPQLQGEMPVIVMEFLSDTEGGEYSIKSTYPPGKWFFYERVLQVPNYVIFDPSNGEIEVYRLEDSGRYQLESANTDGRYWIRELNLFLGVWQGIRENRDGYWLRWWNKAGQLLLWGFELAIQERERAEREQKRAEREQQRAERLLAQLRAAGIEPEA